MAADVDAAIDAIGDVPLPPYIKRAPTRETGNATRRCSRRTRGSVAAPTAGLHLSDQTLARLEARGIERTAITLHVGYGTFQPIRAEEVEAHRIDPEPYEIGEQAAAQRSTAALDARRRIVAVGTTTTRTLEAVAAAHGGRVRRRRGLRRPVHLPRVSIPRRGRAADELPSAAVVAADARVRLRRRASSCSRRIGCASQDGYRFYSYGDAMLVL